MAILLASGSPQRSAILTQLGVPFRVVVPVVEEASTGEPESVATQNSVTKALTCTNQCRDGELVMGVDTIVVLDDRIFGKPTSESGARDMLNLLRGRAHTVTSGLTLVIDRDVHTIAAHTEVVFREFGNDELEEYLATGEWQGRAGGYAIQGAGAGLVKEVSGDFQNVVGLPVAALLELLTRMGMRSRAYTRLG
jgi:septum formation protein